MIHIYVLRDPRDAAIRYVGQTIAPSQRIKGHLSRASSGDTARRSEWMRELLDLDLLPDMEIVEVLDDGQGADEAEDFWIWRLRQDGCDLLNERTAHALGPAARAKISASLRSSEKFQRDHSARQRRLWADPEHRARRSEAIRTALSDPLVSALRRKALKQAWADPELRRRHGELLKRMGNRPPRMAGEENPLSKLTEATVLQMRVRRAAGESVGELASEFGVTVAVASRVCVGEAWRHVGGPLTRTSLKGKLSEDDHEAIRELVRNGLSQAKAAARYGIDPSTVCRLVNGRTRR